MEDWKIISLEDLKEESNNEDLEFSEYGDSPIMYNAEDKGTKYGEEYMVFKDYDDAFEFAVDRVREDLEENPEYFNKDFLMSFIDDNADYWREVFYEMDNGYADDIESESGYEYENRLIDEMVEWDIMSVEEAQSDDAESIAEEKKSEFVDALVEDKMGYGGYKYYSENFGEEDAMKVAIQNRLIDIQEASEEAVNIDGVGHFLSGYDGNEIELSHGAYAFRTN